MTATIARMVPDTIRVSMAIPTPRPSAHISSVSPASGDYGGGIPLQVSGALLTVATGVDLVSGATVYHCADFVIVDASTVTVSTPAVPFGIYDVVVRAPFGDATLVGAFRAWHPSLLVGYASAPHIYDSESGVLSDPVIGWLDQGTGGKDLAATGAERPSYVAARFGAATRHAIKLNATSNMLSLTAPVSFGKRSVFAAIKWGVLSTGPIVSGVGGAGDEGFHDFALDGTGGETTPRTFDADQGFNWRSPNDPSLGDGSPRVLGIIHDGGTGALKFYNGATQDGPTLNDPYLSARASWVQIGAGGGNFFGGELGAIIVVEDAISDADRSLVTTWLHGKFVSRSTKFTIVDGAPPWCARDGAGLLALGNDLYVLGGWNGAAPPPFGGGTSRVTNEVWKSTDFGVIWSLILAEDQSPDPAVRWSPRHTAGWVTHAGYLYVLGSDIFNGPGANPITGGGPGTSDVYRSLDGVTWERMTNDAPWGPRVLHMCASFGGALYVIGGMTDYQNPATALHDVWRSVDGGASWTQLADAPWPARGLVNSGQGLPVFHGKLWMIGGGTYGGQVFSDVWTFDGTAWVNVLGDGAAPWAKREYNATCVWDGVLWIIDGSDVVGSNMGDVWTSPDGVAWTEQTIATWRPSHADGVVPLADRIMKGPGNGDVGSPSDPGTGSVYSITRWGFAP